MKKNLMKLLLTALLITMFASCTTTYATGRNYVGYFTEGVKTSQQSMKVSHSDDTLYKTYDDEFTYDEDGMLMEHIQTYYFNDSDDFDEYIISYQKIGDERLPKSASLNGVVYMEVEYEILASDNEGEIEEYTSSPVFERMSPQLSLLSLLSPPTSSIWTIDDDNYDVPFNYDGKFVTTEEKFGYYTGLTQDRVLNLGYDNIVISKFYYSSSRYNEGYNISLSDDMEEQKESEDKFYITYSYDWEIIGGQIVQNGFSYDNYNHGETLKFEAKREFDEAGRRIQEEWTITDSTNNDGPVSLFTQSLTY